MTIEAAVLGVEHVTGAFIGYTSSGPSGDGILINVYTDSSDLVDLIAVADGSFRAIWSSAPSRPVFIHLALAPVAKPANAQRLESAAIDPTDVVAALGIPGATVTRQLIMIEANYLEQKYGPWKEPAA